MKIDANAIRTVMRILYGKFTVNSREADALCQLLESREEFLAWLLLRNRYAMLHHEVGEILVEVASSTVVTSMSRCKESNFPLFERQEMLSMETAMRSLIEASKTSQEAAEEVNVAVMSFTSRHVNGASIGPALNIKTSG